MKYYKLNGEVFAFESDGSQDDYIKPEMILMSDEEIELHINPPLTDDQKIELITKAIQGHIDAEAQSRGYDDINSIAKYMGYDNIFRAECEALGLWTAQVWVVAHSEMNAWAAGGNEPTLEDVLAILPDFTF